MKTASVASAFSLLAATALAAPASILSRGEKRDYTIQGFTERKYDGSTINTVFFDIASSSDKVSCGSDDNFQAGQVYPCAADSDFSFSFAPSVHDSSSGVSAPNELVLYQKIDDSTTLSGKTSWDYDPICHAGPVSNKDEVCTVQSNLVISITLE